MEAAMLGELKITRAHIRWQLLARDFVLSNFLQIVSPIESNLTCGKILEVV